MLTNGWSDIGYNFLVDKCGTLFEGRKGGVALPVLGAHTAGFNTYTTGVAVLGDYRTIGVGAAVQGTVSHVAAWKLGMSGADPTGQVTLVAASGNGKFDKGEAGTFNRIAGHLDAKATECPGAALHAQLPAIRTYAAGPVTGLTVTGLGGTTRSGTTYYTRGAVTPSWTVTTPSALISRFEVLVDGTVAATTGGTARSATVQFAAGTHRVSVRATHLNKKQSVSAGYPVVSDNTAPVFTARPELSMRTGTVAATVAPVRLSWRAVDNVRAVALTSPRAATYGPTITATNTTAVPGAAVTWSMRATDLTGLAGTASTVRTPVLVPETSAVRAGTWAKVYGTSYLGGAAYRGSTRGAAMTWTFTGRSVAWIASRTSLSGQASVYVDGVYAAIVDTRADTAAHRQALWTRIWGGSATHTVKIVVIGTAGRPAVTTDGIAYIK